MLYCFQQFYNYITAQFFIQVLPVYTSTKLGCFNALLNDITASLTLQHMKTKYLIAGLNNSHFATLDPQKR